MPLHDHWFDVAPEFPLIDYVCAHQRRRGAEASADDFDGDAGVDEFGGVGMSELVDVDLDSGRFAVGLPAVVGGVVRQRPAGTVAAGPEQRAGGVCPVTAAMVRHRI